MNENADPADIFRQESAELLEQLEQALLDLDAESSPMPIGLDGDLVQQAQATLAPMVHCSGGALV